MQKKTFQNMYQSFIFFLFPWIQIFGILTQRPLKKIKAFYLLVMMEKEITNL